MGKYFDYYIVKNDESKLALDWFSYKGNLKRTYKTNDGFYIRVGFFSKLFVLEVRYKFRSREMNERELELNEKFKNFKWSE